jgi:hypothetical protein
MCLAATFLVPGLGALSDQFDPCIAFRFRHRTPYGDFLLSQEPVMSDLHRVDFALATEIVRLNGFVSHDAAGDGPYTLAPRLWVKVSSAL